MPNWVWMVEPLFILSWSREQPEWHPPLIWNVAQMGGPVEVREGTLEMFLWNTSL